MGNFVFRQTKTDKTCVKSDIQQRESESIATGLNVECYLFQPRSLVLQKGHNNTFPPANFIPVLLLLLITVMMAGSPGNHKRLPCLVRNQIFISLNNNFINQNWLRTGPAACCVLLTSHLLSHTP